MKLFKKLNSLPDNKKKIINIVLNSNIFSHCDFNTIQNKN